MLYIKFEIKIINKKNEVTKNNYIKCFTNETN